MGMGSARIRSRVRSPGMVLRRINGERRGSPDVYVLTMNPMALDSVSIVSPAHVLVNI